MVVEDKTGNLVNLAVGDRVRPRGPTRDNLTYGYVREISNCRAAVYWPEIRDLGFGWRPHDLVRL
jgi:hypothetical protein